MIRLYRGDDGRPLNTLLTLGKGRYAVISPDGHFRGSPGIEKELLYVAQTDEGQQTLTPAEFAAKHGWKNDPSRVSSQNGADPADDEARWGPWEELFDGKTLKGWTRVPTVEGKPGGKARVDEGRIILEQGEAFSMIHWGGDRPRIDYELSFETMRLEGNRQFGCVFFPIGPDACRLQPGDKERGFSTLFPVDGRGAWDTESPFTAYVPLSSNEWHSIRLRVTQRVVRVWIAGNLVFDLATADHAYSSTWEGKHEPLALYTVQSAAALRNIRLRRLRPEPPAPRKTP